MNMLHLFFVNMFIDHELEFHDEKKIILPIIIRTTQLYKFYKKFSCCKYPLHSYIRNLTIIILFVQSSTYYFIERNKKKKKRINVSFAQKADTMYPSKELSYLETMHAN